MSAKSIWVMPDPDLPTRASPAPGLPTWARKPSVYSSPDNMAASSGWTDDKDEEIGSNGSIAGLFVEDDEKVGFNSTCVPCSANYLQEVALNIEKQP